MASRYTDPRTPLVIGDGPLTLEEYLVVTEGAAPVTLGSAARERMERHRASLLRQLDGGARIYGVNTGYGADSVTSLDRESIRTVQANTLRSHAMGTGPIVPRELTRGMLLLKANVLAQGYSAVRPAVVELLLEMLNQDIL